MKSTRTTYTADQTVFITEDRTKAVKEGDKAAKFLLVKQGAEITEEQAEKYAGALALIGTGEAKKAAPKSEPSTINTRTPVIQTRDPKHK